VSILEEITTTCLDTTNTCVKVNGTTGLHEIQIPLEVDGRRGQGPRGVTAEIVKGETVFRYRPHGHLHPPEHELGLHHSPILRFRPTGHGQIQDRILLLVVRRTVLS
jgi:hypothetical protein